MTSRLAQKTPAACLALGLLTLAASAAAAPTVTPRVLASFPHDPAAFTQGLVLHEGTLFEGTGLEGESTLRRVDRTTGEVLQSVALPAEHFGEGLALFQGRFVQLTWMHGIAALRDQATFAELGSFSYSGEGWGLCHDGNRFVMTDGSDRLTFRDSTTFEVIGSVAVQEDGVAFTRLNELECVGGHVLANVWLTDTILHIDPETGNVLTKVDAAGLLTPAEASTADVLNGIAFDAATGHYLLTGKLWPKLFEVELQLSPGPAATPSPADAGPDAVPPVPVPPAPPPSPAPDASAGPPAEAPSAPSASPGPAAPAAPEPGAPSSGAPPLQAGDSACSLHPAPASATPAARHSGALAAGFLASAIARRTLRRASRR